MSSRPIDTIYTLHLLSLPPDRLVSSRPPLLTLLFAELLRRLELLHFLQEAVLDHALATKVRPAIEPLTIARQVEAAIVVRQGWAREERKKEQEVSSVYRRRDLDLLSRADAPCN